jgi:deoxyribonuclease V
VDESLWRWPGQAAELGGLQNELAAAADREPAWAPPSMGTAAPERVGLPGLGVAAVFAAFPRGEGGPGAAGQTVVAAAVLWRDGRVTADCIVRGRSGGPYVAGLLALRCGSLLEAAVGGLGQRPDLLLLDATGRDHPRRAGLAVHLGALLGIPSIGATDRVLVATFDEPGRARGSVTPLRVGVEPVGYAVRTRQGARPVLAHAGWRTSPETARDLVLALSRRWRTPLPLRAARTLAREARAAPRSA